MPRPYRVSGTAEIQHLSCLIPACAMPMTAIRPAWDTAGDDLLWGWGNPRPSWWPSAPGFPGSSTTAHCVTLGKAFALSEPRCHHLLKGR